MIKAKNTLEGKLNASIVKEYPELEEITITPTLDGQELESNKYGYSKITVEGIPAIDISIEPTTEEQIKTGIFKKVKVEAVQGETLDIIPTEQSQAKTGIFTQVNINPIQVEEITTDLDFSSSDEIELTAQEGAYIKKATINKDINLTPENIKSGVSILGISGDVADTSDADATSEDIAAGKTAYVNNEKVVGAMEVNNNNAKIGDIDSIYTTAFTLQQVLKKLDFTNIDLKNVFNFTSSFAKYSYLEEVIGLNTSKATTMNSMFYDCSNLHTINELYTGNLGNNTTMNSMFYGCIKLSDESLNNILAMCTKAVKITSAEYKSLKYIGLTSEQATKCQTLSNYQAFLNAGWTTGY